MWVQNVRKEKGYNIPYVIAYKQNFYQKILLFIKGDCCFYILKSGSTYKQAKCKFAFWTNKHIDVWLNLPMGENVRYLKINRNHMLDMPTTTPIMVSLNVIGFKLLSGKWFYDQVTVTLTFDILTQKSIGIICQPWLTKALFMVSLSWRGFMLLSGQWFYAPGHCDLDL